MPESLIIDVHSHAAGLRGAIGSENAPGGWDPAFTLDMMQKTGVGQAVLSPSPFGLTGVPAEQARDRARDLNQQLAEIVARDPNRFGAFGVLPLAGPEYALAEIDYVFDVLKLDGICMPTNVDGAYLGDERFYEVFEALNARNAVIFIHPCGSRTPPEMKLGLADSTIEFMFETTRTLTSLVYNGVLRQLQDLRIITSHGGGAVPYIATRIATQTQTMNKGRIPDTTPEAVLEDLARLYYDLTATMNPMALAAIVELVPKSHLVCGFDCPARAQWLHDKDLQAFRASPLFTGEERDAIRRGNALQLFPRFAKAVPVG